MGVNLTLKQRHASGAMARTDPVSCSSSGSHHDSGHAVWKDFGRLVLRSYRQFVDLRGWTISCSKGGELVSSSDVR